jgi:hypothetical protein
MVLGISVLDDGCMPFVLVLMDRDFVEFERSLSDDSSVDS